MCGLCQHEQHEGLYGRTFALHARDGAAVGRRTPVSVSVVLDTSGSMGFRLGPARTVASEVLKPTTPLDQISLVQASDEPTVISGFERGADRSLGHLQFLRARGGSALLDAIYLGLRQATSGRNERRVLVVISDGAITGAATRSLRSRMQSANPVSGSSLSA